jgi:Fe-Mn family superoxide dismutase
MGHKRFPKDLIQSIGGYVNHSLLWYWLQPPIENNKPFGLSEKLIDYAFGSFEKFQEKIALVVSQSFGSQWLWLNYSSRKGEISISLSENQENPLMNDEHPLFGIDLWEHSYLLDFESKKQNYVDALWKITNWHIVNQRINNYIYT